MNVEIGAEATQFPEKEYINGIAVAVYISRPTSCKKIKSIEDIDLFENCKSKSE